MKTPYYVLGLAALFAGAAMADTHKIDAPDALQADKDGDGRMSRAEATSSGAERSGEWFDKLDLNKDGYVTQEEVKQARETRAAKHGDMKEKMEARFKEADANSDGQISLDEAQAKMPRLAEKFSTLDTDKNGLLSKDELKHGAHRRQSQPQS